MISTRPSIPQTDPPRSPRQTLPSMYDLPSEFPEELGLPDEFHDLQPSLLSRALSLSGYSRTEYFTGTDLNIYYDLRHPLWHKRPDWFLALNVPRLYDGWDLRRSYVIWQEGESPTIVVEFLSPRTEKEDLGRFYQEGDRIEDNQEHGDREGVLEKEERKTPSKLVVYEQYLRVPHYLVYSRYTQGLRYFKLVGGRYQEQRLRAENPLVWFEDLHIGLGLWQGEFDALPATWLRWCDHTGNWLPTDTEQAEQRAETQRLTAQAERLAKEEAQQKVERLAQRLRELGIDPEEV